MARKHAKHDEVMKLRVDAEFEECDEPMRAQEFARIARNLNHQMGFRPEYWYLHWDEAIARYWTPPDQLAKRGYTGPDEYVPRETEPEQEVKPEHPVSRGTATYFGKVCSKHPDLKGARNNRYECVTCFKDRRRANNTTFKARREFTKFADSMISESYCEFDRDITEIMIQARIACRTSDIVAPLFFGFLAAAELKVRGGRIAPLDRTDHDARTTAIIAEAKSLCRMMGIEERFAWMVWDDAVDATIET